MLNELYHTSRHFIILFYTCYITQEVNNLQIFVETRKTKVLRIFIPPTLA